MERLIVLVEDDPALRASVQTHLAKESFRVEIASDHEGAVALLAHVVPDVVIVDTTLPRESGYETCEWMRAQERFRMVPILIMSDRLSPESIAHAEMVGGNAFLRKPFTREQLIKHVRALLDGPLSNRPSVRSLQRLGM